MSFLTRLRTGAICGALVALPSFAAELTLDVTFGWQKQALPIPSPPVTTTAGQIVGITRVSALLSEIALVRPDGSSVQLAGQFGYIDAASGRHRINLRDVPEGDYAGLQFRVGLPPSTNHADPGQWPANHPLNPLTNALHWGWQGGYIFLAVEGHFAPQLNQELDGGFSFHLATDALALPVRFTQPFTLRGDSQITLLFDLADWLAELPLSDEAGTTSTHSRPGDPLAQSLAERVGRSFWFGGATSLAPAVPTSGHTNQPNQPNHDPRSASVAEAFPFVVPAGWPQPELPADNAPSRPGVALGESLFHDVRLSKADTQSCADCHQPQRAFSDQVPLSTGADGLPGARNAMPLFNLAWSPNFAWDGSQPRIRDQSLAALTNPIEMHGDLDSVVARLRTDADLAPAFAATFGDPEISADRIGRALEQYLLTLISADSRFDRSLRGEVTLSTEERRGFELFNTEFDPRREQFGADCFHCHGGPLFTDYAAKNNGLDLVSLDRGRARVTHADQDTGKFKTPSLRNIAATAPYMHDGRFETLADVVTHYVSGVQRSPNLDPNLAKHPTGGVPLSLADQSALVAFLRTLSSPPVAFAGQTGS